MTRGGKRPGAGRPKGSTSRSQVHRPSGQINMRWPPEIIEEVNRLAERQGMTRTEWVLKTVTRELQKFRPR